MKAIIFFQIFLITTYMNAKNITIGFMGDVMLGRGVNEIISTKGYRYVWPNLIKELQKNNINILNLEMALTNSTTKVPKVFNFKASPDRANVLRMANITVVNNANNHILDYGPQGLIETLTTLDKLGIKHVGAGLNEAQAKKPIIINKNGIRIGIIGATDNEPTWKALKDKLGTNYIDVSHPDNLVKEIIKLRPLVDILILSMHWGPNMVQRPSSDFIKFAHLLVDNGLDIFHGHSAHLFQGIEIYKNKLIMYDTGDFIDDYAVDPILRNDQSFLFNVKVNKKGIESVELIPVIISNMQVNKAIGKEKESIITKIQKLSSEFKTHIDESGIINIKNK